jgi:hypothetical protein
MHYCRLHCSARFKMFWFNERKLCIRSKSKCVATSSALRKAVWDAEMFDAPTILIIFTQHIKVGKYSRRQLLHHNVSHWMSTQKSNTQNEIFRTSILYLVVDCVQLWSLLDILMVPNTTVELRNIQFTEYHAVVGAV